MGERGQRVFFSLSLGNNIMTKQEMKTYILANWKVSSGKRIALMTKRYFAIKSIDEKIGQEQKDAAEKIFGAI